MPSRNYAETTTALAGAAVFTGPSRSSDIRFTQFSAIVFADQTGTLSVQWSSDNSTWTKAAADVSVSANAPATLTVYTLAPYYRVVFTNGATPNTICRIRSGFTSTG